MMMFSTKISNAHLHSDLTNGTVSPTVRTRWNEVSSGFHRITLPVLPASWSPNRICPNSRASRDFCIPKQEPRPPNDILRRLSLSACSPSLAKFSRANIVVSTSISTSTTSLSSTTDNDVFLHRIIQSWPGNRVRFQSYQLARCSW